MRERIIAEAFKEVRQRGLKFTMDDIVRALHISKSSLYGAVGSKDGLVKEMMTRIASEYDREADEIRRTDNDALTKLRLLVRLYSKFFAKYSNGIFHDLKVMYPKLWQDWQDFQREKVALMVELLERGMAEGRVRDVSPELVYACTTACMRVMSDPEFLERCNITYSQAIDMFIDVLFHGLTKE